MKCKHCGRTHPNRFNFCPETGRPIRDVHDVMGDEGLLLVKFKGESREKMIELTMNNGFSDEETASFFVDNTAYLMHIGDNEVAARIRTRFIEAGADAIIVEKLNI